MEAMELATSPRSENHKPTAASEEQGGLRKTAAEVASSLEQLYRAGDVYLGRQAQERPYRVLGVAAGIGFALGGGLAWKIAGALVPVIARMAFTHAASGWAISSLPHTSEAPPIP